MKSFSILFCFVFLLLFLGCSNGNKSNEIKHVIKNDLQELNLRGKVQSSTTIPYNAVQDFDKIDKVDITDGFFGKTYLEFNEDGNQIAFIGYKGDGNLNTKYSYKYDNEGNRLEKMSEDVDFITGESAFSKTVYSYDDKGNLVEENEYKLDGRLVGKVTYRYDKKGNLTDENVYNSDGSLDGKRIMNYDDNGNMSERRNIDPSLNLDWRFIFNYDEKGIRIESRFYRDAVLERKTTYEYDDKGNVVKESEYKSDGSLKEEKRFVYEFDENKNWIKKIEYLNELPKSIVERTIEYYE